MLAHDNTWNSERMNGVMINGFEADLFSTSWNNPFSRKYSLNSLRYMAVRVPREWIKENDQFLTITLKAPTIFYR